MHKKNPGLVWIVAGMGLFTYATIGFLGQGIPGVENLVTWLNGLSGNWIVLAAFVAILIEGLYFVGSFFPGSTIIILVAVLSQTQSWLVFFSTILAIYLGWVMAGLINVLLAHKLKKLHTQDTQDEVDIKDRLFTTWYPAFRANQEVAQVVAGAKPGQVFLSSLRVKTIASFFAALGVASLPLFIDITELSNEEGFTTVFIVGAISLIVGLSLTYKQNKNN